MNKRVEGERLVYSQSRRILLLLLIPLPALLIVSRFVEFNYGWLPILVTSLFALAGLGLGLTHEVLVLDFATRQGLYKTAAAGVFKTSRSFSFNDVVGIHFMETIPSDTVDGRRVAGSQTLFYVYLLYRGADGALADQIELGVYPDKADALKEANDLTQRIGGKVYLTKDLPTG